MSRGWQGWGLVWGSGSWDWRGSGWAWRRWTPPQGPHGFSVGEGAWRGVPRDPKTSIHHYVPFLTSEIFASPDEWRRVQADALEEGVKISLRGRRSHNHPKGWRTVLLCSPPYPDSAVALFSL